MRADRLLSILLMLQRRGRMTARQLAVELEVSERTIYRDIDALGMAGVPVYGEAGPDGGYALLDDFRTHLTGLNEREIQALFMLTVPSPLSDLGVSQSLKSALLKVFASLPVDGDGHEHWVQQRFLMDTVPWPDQYEPVSHLPAVQEAVWHDRRMLLSYRIGPLASDIEQIVDPYSLVAKAGVWYIVYTIHGHIRAMRVDSLRHVTILGETFDRREDYDLATFWAGWCASQAAGMGAYSVTMHVCVAALPDFRQRFGQRVDRAVDFGRSCDVEEWVTIDLSFDSLVDARRHLLPFGRAVEVLTPVALRESIRDHARQIMTLYD